MEHISNCPQAGAAGSSGNTTAGPNSAGKDQNIRRRRKRTRTGGYAGKEERKMVQVNGQIGVSQAAHRRPWKVGQEKTWKSGLPSGAATNGTWLLCSLRDKV